MDFSPWFLDYVFLCKFLHAVKKCCTVCEVVCPKKKGYLLKSNVCAACSNLNALTPPMNPRRHCSAKIT